MKILREFLNLFIIKDDIYILEKALNNVLYHVSRDPWIFKLDITEKLEIITRLKTFDIPGIEKLEKALCEFIRVDMCDYIGCSRINSFRFIDSMDIVEKCDIAYMIITDMED